MADLATHADIISRWQSIGEPTQAPTSEQDAADLMSQVARDSKAARAENQAQKRQAKAEGRPDKRKADAAYKKRQARRLERLACANGHHRDGSPVTQELRNRMLGGT